jgi:hypothetical protein
MHAAAPGAVARAPCESAGLRVALVVQNAAAIMNQKGLTILILAGVATLFCAIGTFTHHWRSDSKGSMEANVGLRTLEECRKDHCESATWGEVRGHMGKSNAATIGPITFFIGIAAVLLLAALVAAMLLAPQRASQVGPIAGAAAVLFVGMGVAYILSFPADFLPTSWSAYLAWLGGAAGTAAGGLSTKFRSA